MSQTVIILGVKGRFGRAAANAFVAAGWHVRGFARNWPDTFAVDGIEKVEGDAFDKDALASAAEGCDVILNALNPPYKNWPRDVPRLTESVIHAAKVSGAAVMIPGNVYNYGEQMPETLTEMTPHLPTTEKGRLREEMEEAFAIAGDVGVQTIILRAGDFIERQKTGNWFDTYIAAKVAQGRVTYPGPLELVHAWAYLPDMARAMVGLAEKRSDLAVFEEFVFGGLNLTGAELITAIEKESGRSLKVGKMPWSIMKVVGLVTPTIREVVKMRYLWNVPHAIDDTKLRRALPQYQPTPLEHIMADALSDVTAG